MATTNDCRAMMDCISLAADEKRSRQKGNGVFALVVSGVLILLFLLYIGPRLTEHIPLFQPVAQYIEEHDIEANMYFYTEVETFSDAQINMMNTMNHMPGRRTTDKP